MGSQTTKAPKATAPKKPKLKFQTLSQSSQLEGDLQPPSKRLKALHITPPKAPAPVIDLTSDDGSTSKRANSSTLKKKGKAKDVVAQADEDARLWTDIYTPTTSDELAVHKRKIEDVRRWLLEALEGGPNGKLRKYRRILVMTGSAGIGKTATLHVLARELELDILEWRNGVSEGMRRQGFDGNFDPHYDSLADKFSTFLNRAGKYNTILGASQTGSSSRARRRIVVLEDLPNVLHPPMQDAVHSALRSFVEVQEGAYTPLVVIISDAGMRGEDPDDTGGGVSRWRSKDAAVVDIRTVVPKDLLNGPYVTQIAFNPIAPTFLRKSLQTMLAKVPNGRAVSKETLDFVVDTTHGDIRSAVMALQFACVAEMDHGAKRKRGQKRATNVRSVLEAVTRRESSLALFHLLGKVLYNKRKGDPANTSATKAELQREREIDARLQDPPPLPPHLRDHERRTSRVDVEALYADSPIDTSLFSLYLHQNYTQFCDTLEQCSVLVDSLSAVDADDSLWQQANPHRFHLLARGALHALPSPVPRRGQKVYKPAFFETLARTRECADAVQDTREWLDQMPESAGCWTQAEIATGVGAVLKARGAGAGSPPTSHRVFSALSWRSGDTGATELEEDDALASIQELEDDDVAVTSRREVDAAGNTRNWLEEEDDIEDF